MRVTTKQNKNQPNKEKTKKYNPIKFDPSNLNDA